MEIDHRRDMPHFRPSYLARSTSRLIGASCFINPAPICISHFVLLLREANRAPRRRQVGGISVSISGASGSDQQVEWLPSLMWLSQEDHAEKPAAIDVARSNPRGIIKGNLLRAAHHDGSIGRHARRLL